MGVRTCIKVRDQAHSEEIQTKLFILGYRWGGENPTEILNPSLFKWITLSTEYYYLFTNVNGNLTWDKTPSPDTNVIKSEEVFFAKLQPVKLCKLED